MMTRVPVLITVPALLLALAGCGDNPEPAAAPTTGAPLSSAPAVAVTSSPTPSPSPTVDPDAPHKFGTTVTLDDRYVTATVYGYKQPVAKTAPRPDEQAGFVWGAADVKVCSVKNAPKMTISNSPWTLTYADDTTIEASSVGYEQFPEPAYPWGEKVVAPGRCVRGWITYPVPGKKRPMFVEYAPESVTPIRWAVN